MLFSQLSLIPVALFCISCIASPAPTGNEKRQSDPFGNYPIGIGGSLRSSGSSQSSNWGGWAVSGPSGTFTNVTSSFNIPTVKDPGLGKDGTGGAAWVGIDGIKCGGTVVKGGVAWIIEGGQVYYRAFAEWLPYSYVFVPLADLPVAGGNLISVTVNVLDTSNVQVMLASGGVEMTASLEGIGSSLCRENAEWVVEDFNGDFIGISSPIPMADFSPISWSNSYATTSDKKRVDISSYDTVFNLALKAEGGRVAAQPLKWGNGNILTPWTFYVPGKGRANQGWDGYPTPDAT